MKAPKSRAPVTIRAMLAADCSGLPQQLRHFVHVLALHADNTSGRGLTGQAMLGRYMGLSSRQIRRLWARLDELWNAQQSPVTALREARWHTSDAYRMLVREDAPLRLESLACLHAPTLDRRSAATPSHMNACSVSGDVGAAPTSAPGRPASRSDIQGVNRTSEASEADIQDSRSDMGVRFTPSQADMGVLQSTEYASTEAVDSVLDLQSSRPQARPVGRRGAGRGTTEKPDAMARAAAKRAARVAAAKRDR